MSIDRKTPAPFLISKMFVAAEAAGLELEAKQVAFIIGYVEALKQRKVM